MNTATLKTLITGLTIALLTACSKHQQIIIDGPATAHDNFRLTRPLQKPTKSQLAFSSKNHDQVPNVSLSAGDKIKLDILGDKEFTGVYTIDIDGFLKLPYLNPVYANGLELNQLQKSIKSTLISEKIFTQNFLKLSVTPVQWAATYINIKGAVYKPGNIIINERDFSKENQQLNPQSGDFADKRLLSNAIKAAGGLRPDANLTNIQLIRGERHYFYDLSGLITGGKLLHDPILSNADTIIVTSLGFLQKELLQVSRVTPPGFRVFLSNLTVPSTSNNTSAIGKFSSSLPIGSRLLTAAMSANCVGGTASVNANRYIVLAGMDTQTNQLKVMQKSIQQLLNDPNTDQTNPYLLPNDHIACFDSTITNWRDIGRALGDIVMPFKVLGGGL